MPSDSQFDAQSLIAQIEEAGAAAVRAVEQSADASALEQARVRHQGKKSHLTELMRSLKSIDSAQRPEVGRVANRVKTEFSEALDKRLEEFRSKERGERLAQESVDVTLPGRPHARGHAHPITIVRDEIEDIFCSMGFEVASGPDMEEEYYNFEALNFPPDHPAHDLHDTFYLQGGGVLRTHTSPVQIRMMRRRRPPLAVIAPGVVYRPDADLTHTPMFHQVEGFLVDTRVRFSDLKGVLSAFLKRMMGPDVRYRFRPSYFPFTEPSAEIDIMWQVEGRDPEWLEVLGSGMIHPNVLRAGGYDPDEVTGFAFGLGVERFAMLKYAIPNIHLFYENDLRFLTQF